MERALKTTVWKFLAFTLLVLVTIGCGRDARQTSSTEDAENLFTTLRAVEIKPEPFSFERPFYDMHGNAHPATVELMQGRFKFTQAICAELDSSPHHPKPYRGMLYHVLAVAKDPDAIPWLERVRSTPSGKSELAEHWLPHWATHFRGAAPEQLKWLTGADRWAAFFRKWIHEEPDSERLAIVEALRGWFHDAETLEFFRRIERSEDSSPQELLNSQLYLTKHGENINTQKLSHAIQQLAVNPSNTKFLVDLADDMPDPAFIPWLLTLVEERPTEDYANAQWCLERITFRRDVHGRSAWQTWFKNNGGKSRHQWMQEASFELIQLAQTNIPAADAFFDKAAYRWKDPLMFDTMEALAVHQQLHNHLVGWINLTYGHYHSTPGLRQRCRALALKLRVEGADNLSRHYREMMQQWDFLNPDAISWEQYIRYMNMGV